MSEEIRSVVSGLLPNSSLENLTVTPIFGGRNNRAFYIKHQDTEYFLKQYNKQDANNRLHAEYAFLKYAESKEFTYTVKPVSFDSKNFFALYEYVNGRRFEPHEISKLEIDHAIKFIDAINTTRLESDLPNAREACFTLSDHFGCVDSRIENLNHTVISNDIDAEAAAFIQQTLKPAWLAIKEKAILQAKQYGIALDVILENKDRIISPSDFGFHNALKQSDDKITFVDFEYAGWDDPAKLIGDFFNQIEVPIPLSYFEEFSQSISQLVINRNEMLNRANLLFPVYNIKWCCIILNYFLVGSRIAKGFAEAVTQSVCEKQLEKAKLHLQRIDI